jgi:hypothetical protein
VRTLSRYRRFAACGQRDEEPLVPAVQLQLRSAARTAAARTARPLCSMLPTAWATALPSV